MQHHNSSVTYIPAAGMNDNKLKVEELCTGELVTIFRVYDLSEEFSVSTYQFYLHIVIVIIRSILVSYHYYYCSLV